MFAICNRKGGVGKTTTAFNVGAIAAAEHNQRVLLVDIDSSYGLTSLCDVEAEVSLANVFAGEASAEEVIVPIRENLDLLPSAETMSIVEAQLFSQPQREFFLKWALDDVAPSYDLVIIDCTPTYTLLTLNALAAAHQVIIPCKPSMIDVRQTQWMLTKIGEVRAKHKQRERNINPNLAVFGVLLTEYREQLILHRNVRAALSGIAPLLETTIGSSIRIAEAATVHQPLREYDPRNKQLQTYRSLTEAIIHG